MFQGLFPPPREDVDNDRVLTGDSAKPVSTSGHISNRFRWPLLTWVGRQLTPYVISNHPIAQCLFATGLTMADGVLTPAVSVTSAAGGIAVAKPAISSANDIVGISLVCIFPPFHLPLFVN